jgi:hypothetical protein
MNSVICIKTGQFENEPENPLPAPTAKHRPVRGTEGFTGLTGARGRKAFPVDNVQLTSRYVAMSLLTLKSSFDSIPPKLVTAPFRNHREAYGRQEPLHDRGVI